MAKKKAEKSSNKKTKKHRLSKPEEMFFGFLVIVSIFFAAFCFASVKQIPEVLPSKIYHKSASGTENKINKMVLGYPMRKMMPFLGKQDDKVAAFLVAIAKKESNWGKFTPKKNGKECFNYWGYRGPENPTRSGYSCFDSPKQAVKIVGRRIRNLIAQNVDTPKEMVMWKCGTDCIANSSPSANKWVKDVGFYYGRIYE